MIYVIEDDAVMAECIANACAPHRTKIFHSAITAIAAMATENPALILLDILLTGPDGFTFLNEIVSYEDSSSIPVAIISSLNLAHHNLAGYGVVQILDKAKMLPSDIKALADVYAN